MTTAPLPASAARQRFRRRLLDWYRANGRDLPWRTTDDPYHILVSEVMLQQTQVDRVLPKYHEWLEKYPSLTRTRRGRSGRGHRDLAAARLQHPSAAASCDRARVGGALRRRAAQRRRDAAVVQGHRRLHRRSDSQLRLRPARGDSRHQRRPRPAPRVRRHGRRQGARDETTPLDAVRSAGAAQSMSSTSTRR